MASYKQYFEVTKSTRPLQVSDILLTLPVSMFFRRICEVCKTWKDICHSDKAAWRKRTEFLKVAKLKIVKLGKVLLRILQLHL